MKSCSSDLYHASWWFDIFFIFTPKIGEMIQFDEHIFQMGWFNHQAVFIHPLAGKARRVVLKNECIPLATYAKGVMHCLRLVLVVVNMMSAAA